MDSRFPQNRSTDPGHQRKVRLLILVILAFVLVGLWTIRPDAVRAAVERMDSVFGRSNDVSHQAPMRAEQPEKADSGT